MSPSSDMKILGKGHYGVVLLAANNTVAKYYKTAQDWQEEKEHLMFLASIQEQGFDIDCTIPRLLIPIRAGDRFRVKPTLTAAKWSLCLVLRPTLLLMMSNV